MFLIGILVFLGIVKGITSFIWGVELIKDDVIVEDKQLLANLEELGIGVGTRKAKINPARLSNELMIKRNEFSWIGVEVTGMKLRLKLVEKVIFANADAVFWHLRLYSSADFKVFQLYKTRNP